MGYKVLILNQSTFKPTFREVDEACRNTWASSSPDNVKIIHYYGSKIAIEPSIQYDLPEIANRCGLHGDRLVVDTYDVYVNPSGVDETDFRPEKQVLSMEYVLDNFQFEYLYRTNCVSYIDIKNLLKFIDKQNSKKVYTGSVWEENGPNPGFASGNNALMSRDVVELVVKNKDRYLEMHKVYKTNKAEDVMLGALLILDLKYLDKIKRNPEIEQYDLRVQDFKTVDRYHWKANYQIGKDSPELFYKLHELKLSGKI